MLNFFLKKVFYIFYLKYTKKYFLKSLSRTEVNYIFDVDNTIANTWPTLKLYWNSESERLSKIEPINKMIKYVMLLEKNNNIIYLTVRDFRLKTTLILW